MNNEKPAVWQMVKEAIEYLGGKAKSSDIKEYISKKYPGTNERTIGCQIIGCTVNIPSRTGFTYNNKPRISNSRYDFLFKTGRGEFELYDKEKHGIWEIINDESGNPKVSPVESKGDIEDLDLSEENELNFEYEKDLQNFIIGNFGNLKIHNKKMELYTNDEGQIGVQYPAKMGKNNKYIDILAEDEDDEFVVIELKVKKGSDDVMGQLTRYMGWVKENLSPDKDVHGIIIAKEITEDLIYSSSMVPNVRLLKYNIEFNVEPIERN